MFFCLESELVRNKINLARLGLELKPREYSIGAQLGFLLKFEPNSTSTRKF